MIYPVDSAIRLYNNWGQESEKAASYQYVQTTRLILKKLYGKMKLIVFVLEQRYEGIMLIGDLNCDLSRPVTRVLKRVKLLWI